MKFCYWYVRPDNNGLTTTAWRRRPDDDGLTTKAWQRRPDDEGLMAALLAWWQQPDKYGLTMTCSRRPDNDSRRTTAGQQQLNDDGLNTALLAWWWRRWPDHDGLTIMTWGLWPMGWQQWPENEDGQMTTAWGWQPNDSQMMTATQWQHKPALLDNALRIQNRPNDSKLKTPQASFWGRFACQSLTLLKLKNAFCLPNKGSKNEGWPHRSCFGKHDSFHFAISRPCVTIITAAATQFWLLLVLADHELLFLSSTRSLPQQFSWWALECKDA